MNDHYYFETSEADAPRGVAPASGGAIPVKHINSYTNHLRWKRTDPKAAWNAWSSAFPSLVPGISRTERIDMTWHHTIPRDRMAALWNYVRHAFFKTAGDPAKDQYVRKTATETLAQLLNLISIRHDDQKTIIDAITAADLAGEEDAAARPKLDSDMRDLIAMALLWPSWNVVEGPTRRTDDPGAKYEDWPRTGLNSSDQNTLGQLGMLNTTIEECVPERGSHDLGRYDAATMSTLGTVIANTRKIVTGRRPIPFTPQMWRPTSKGSSPTWEKALRASGK